MGKKCIIEMKEGERLYKTKLNALNEPVIREIICEPYTEDSAYAHGYTEAESKYREIRDELEKQAYQRGYETAKHECEDCQKIRADAEQELVKKAYDTAYADAEEIYESGKRAMYQKGLIDAWEAAGKIGYSLKSSIVAEIFGTPYSSQIFSGYTASECIEKIRAYEQGKKEEQVHVGDEVISPNGKGVVTEITDRYVRIMYVKGSGQVVKPEDLTKTGRHFVEIDTVLEKMKENNDNK